MLEKSVSKESAMPCKTANWASISDRREENRTAGRLSVTSSGPINGLLAAWQSSESDGASRSSTGILFACFLGLEQLGDGDLGRMLHAAPWRLVRLADLCRRWGLAALEHGLEADSSQRTEAASAWSWAEVVGWGLVEPRGRTFRCSSPASTSQTLKNRRPLRPCRVKSALIYSQ